MKREDVKKETKKLYDNIKLHGIEAVKKLFAKEDGLSQEIRFNPIEEYIKRMLISQIDINLLLENHKFYYKGIEGISEYNAECKKLREQINSDNTLVFNEETINILFGNPLNITSDDEHEKWYKILHSNLHNGVSFDDIFKEEIFKYNYENEKNIVKKIINSFRYKKMTNNSALEDKYIQQLRQILRKEISKHPEQEGVAYREAYDFVDRGIKEYPNIKTIEDMSRMSLIPFIAQYNQGPIDIEEICKQVRGEMTSSIGSTRIGEEYRKVSVTLVPRNNKGNSFEPIPFEEVPQAIKQLQKDYEELYNGEHSTEEYINGATKIYADFMFIQPYEDGNKRTALCLFDSMLLSKDIIPPPISVINDEKMVEAFHKVQDEKDYSALQGLIMNKYSEMQQHDASDATAKEKTDNREENGIEK